MSKLIYLAKVYCRPLWAGGFLGPGNAKQCTASFLLLEPTSSSCSLTPEASWLPFRFTWSLVLSLEAPCLFPVACRMLAGRFHLLPCYMAFVV